MQQGNSVKAVADRIGRGKLRTGRETSRPAIPEPALSATEVRLEFGTGGGRTCRQTSPELDKSKTCLA